MSDATYVLNPPHLLTRHNERSPNVSVLDEPLPVREFQFLG